MSNHESYDVAITGGGLAGLSAAILLAKEGYRVILFEKEKYPFHKVCGEYISLESWNFLSELGIALTDWSLPMITELMVSAPGGRYLTHALPLGGFGVSRYRLDDALAQIAKRHGVVLQDNTTVQEISFENEMFSILSDKLYTKATVCMGAFGKRSNLDVKWKRSFVKQKPNSLNNYIGVKYHVRLDHPNNMIALHNFSNGYCGVSPIENDKYCICYLTTAHNLQANGKSLEVLEKKVLMENPFLNKVFGNAQVLYEKPLSISQISFQKKSQVENHIIMLGDAAGMIAPLCGNGMSMALRSSSLAAVLVSQFLDGSITRQQMEVRYVQQWHKAFENRLRAGRAIQALFGKKWLTNLTVQTLGQFPFLMNSIIRQTHGTEF